MQIENVYYPMTSSNRKPIFTVHMNFRGADYSFEVVPELSAPAFFRYNIYRDGDLVFYIGREGDTWVDAQSGESSHFIRALGRAISTHLV
jgi:hypothetical protein